MSIDTLEAGVSPRHAPAAARQLVALPGTEWRFWRSICVRGAGFPARLAEALAAPAAAAAADAWLAARARRAQLIAPVMDRLSAELRALPARHRKPLRDLRTHIREGGPVDAGAGADAVIGARASADVAAARAAFQTEYEKGVEAVRQRLLDISCEPAFREAMLWQGAETTRRIGSTLEPDGRAKHQRRALRKIAMRVQRYCLKNDTIGFFGPFGWGRFDEQADGIETAPEESLVNYREVFFEGWSIDAVARALEAAHDLRAWAAPRIKAGVWIHEGRAWRPLRKPAVLTDAERAVLALCDGLRPATEIASLLRAPSMAGGAPAATSGASSSASEVFAVLERLALADVVSWRLEVAPQLRPELELRERLARIGDAALRTRCLSELDELTHARDEVAAAAGDVDRLDRALAHLEAVFTRLTGQPASRRGGQTYGARAVVYEDCRRADLVRVGGLVLDALAPAMSILLDTARWVSAEVGDVLRRRLRGCYAELRAQQPGDIDCHAFVSYVVSSVWLAGEGGEAAGVFDATVARVQRLWDGVLGDAWDTTAARATVSVEAIAARARDAFPPRRVGWSLGRQVSPDLMIAAASLEAIRRGDFTAVLGEIHGGNSIAQMIDVATHPDPRELFEAAAAETSDETVVLRAVPRAAWIPRMSYAVTLPHYLQYGFGDDPPNHPPCRPLPAGKLVIAEHDGAIVARARDGSLEFDAVELFGNPLLDEVNRVMGALRPRLRHSPRLTIGQLTIARERWQFPAAQMPFRHQADAAQQFLELREWGRAHGMPRWVFVKAPSEMKPWVLDFDSPVFAEIFSSIVKQLPDDAEVAIVEMLPGIEDLWLADREDRRYTCELRCAARHRGDSHAAGRPPCTESA